MKLILINYKQCYESCKICKINGDHYIHNSLECKDQYKYNANLENTDYKNCYMENISRLNNFKISLKRY